MDHFVKNMVFLLLIKEHIVHDLLTAHLSLISSMALYTLYEEGVLPEEPKDLPKTCLSFNAGKIKMCFCGDWQ